MTEITFNAVINNLQALALEMREVALQLEYHGGLNSQIVEKSKQLFGAAKITDEWAKGMREEFLAKATDLND